MSAAELIVAGPITRDTTMLVDGIPAAGGSAVARELRVAAGGKGASPARIAAGLGAHVRLLGAVGDDETGDAVLRELVALGRDVTGVHRLSGPTGQIVHVVEPGGARRYFEARGANGELRLRADEITRACAPGTTLLLSTAIPADAVEIAASSAAASGARVVVDAAGEPAVSRAVLPHADVVRCDAGEAEALTGMRVTGWESAEAAARGLLDTGPRLAVVQAAGEGDVAVTRARAIRLPRLDVSLTDPTGSGDALVATLAVELARGAMLEDAARRASRAAALAVTHLGAV
jgi:ribokinase